MLHLLGELTGIAVRKGNVDASFEAVNIAHTGQFIKKSPIIPQ